jgi:hypothetical protein
MGQQNIKTGLPLSTVQKLVAFLPNKVEPVVLVLITRIYMGQKL